MAIDILSRHPQMPMVVGDKANIKAYQRCAIKTVGDEDWIMMSDDAEAAGGCTGELRYKLLPETARNLSASEHELLVSFNAARELIHAFKTPINNPIGPV